MFEGFRSRCRMPRWWAWWTARATVAISRAAALWIGGEVRQPPGQAAALDQLHAEVTVPVMPAHLEDRHDVGMVQVGRRLGLLAEPLLVGLARQSVRPGAS